MVAVTSTSSGTAHRIGSDNQWEILEGQVMATWIMGSSASSPRYITPSKTTHAVAVPTCRRRRLLVAMPGPMPQVVTVKTRSHRARPTRVPPTSLVQLARRDSSLVTVLTIGF